MASTPVEMETKCDKERICFVYGTLMSPQVIKTLIKRCPKTMTAILPKHHRFPVIGKAFPGAVSSTTLTGTEEDRAHKDDADGLKGILLFGITPAELDIFDWYEDEGKQYKRTPVRVLVPDESRTEEPASDSDSDSDSDLNGRWIGKDVETYLWAGSTSQLELTSHWSYERFQKTRLERYLQNPVVPCRSDIANRRTQDSSLSTR